MQDRGALSDAMEKMDGAENSRGMHSLKSFGVTAQERGSVSPAKLDDQSSTVAIKRGVGCGDDSQAKGAGSASSSMPLASFLLTVQWVPGAGGARGSNRKIMDPKKMSPNA